MPEPRFAPDFRLEINGKAVPAELRSSITSVRYQTSLNAADRVELTIANEQLRWLDHRLFNLRNELTLSLGYAPDPLKRVFKGEIIGRAASFGDGPTVTIAAQDRLARLQEGNKVRWFAVPIPSVLNAPIPDPAVAAVVSLENGLIPILDPIGAAISVILGGIELIAAIGDPDTLQRVIRKQDKESDFDFLRRICLENGWEMFVDQEGPRGGHQLRFFSPLDHLSPDVTLAYGRSLLDFNSRLTTVGQLLSVTAFVWVAPIKTDFAVTVGWDWDENALKISIRPALIPLREGPTDFLIEEPVTPASAPRVILSHFLPRLNGRVTGSGTTLGDPKIRAGKVMRLEELGVECGGLHRVVSATHRVDASGYVTSFDVRKEVWFTSIPLPDQGAVPVRVAAPIPA
jgi:uncharacterized protein